MTGDKPAKPAEPASAVAAPSEATAQTPSSQAPQRLFRPSPKTVRHIAIEIFIVTVGVLLALGIDQLRQHYDRQGQADEARKLIRAEITTNLHSVEQSMPRLAEAYRLIGAEPESAPAIYDRGRFGTPLLVDTAYELSVQNGALSYLGPAERSQITIAYREALVHGDRVERYSDAMRELASYAVGPVEGQGEAAGRARQAKLTQVLATALFRSQCRLVLRFSEALGEPRTRQSVGEYCGGITPLVDVEVLIAGRHEPPPTHAPQPSEAPN